MCWRLCVDHISHFTRYCNNEFGEIPSHWSSSSFNLQITKINPQICVLSHVDVVTSLQTMEKTLKRNFNKISTQIYIETWFVLTGTDGD